MQIIVNFYFFFHIVYESVKIIFTDKNINKSSVTKTKAHSRQIAQMAIKYQYLKKNDMVQKSPLNTLLGMIIMMSLDHYV